MDDPQPSQLNIQLACDDATDEELDRLRRGLLSRLLETPAVIGVTQGWVSNGPGCTVKFSSKDFEFEGSPADLQKVPETYNRRNSMK